MPVTPSPILDVAGAVPGPDDTGQDESLRKLRARDASVVWHFGDPLREQRAAVERVAVVDRSNRFVIAIGGPERLSWLHTISSQHVAELRDGDSAENLSLDANGRVEHHFVLTDLDGTLWLDTEPDTGPALLAFLQKMVFWAKAEPRDGNDYAVLSLLGPQAREVLPDLPVDDYRAVPLPELSGRSAGSARAAGFVRKMPWPGSLRTGPNGQPSAHSFDLVVPRAQLVEVWQQLVDRGATPAGLWAFEALRVAALRPRLGIDTDERTIPHEVGWIGGVDTGGAVHLDKGCYRGQETVARVHNLGKPPRRLVLLHLDGSAEGRPAPGDPVTADGRPVGRIGTVVDHYELGPIALALVKRNVTADTALAAGPCAAAIDPDSVAVDEHPQAGRLAVERLRGR